MRDNQPTEQLKIELLSQWKLEAESRKKYILQKKWSKNLIPAPGNGKSNLPPPYMRLPPPTR